MRNQPAQGRLPPQDGRRIFRSTHPSQVLSCVIRGFFFDFKNAKPGRNRRACSAALLSPYWGDDWRSAAPGRLHVFFRVERIAVLSARTRVGAAVRSSSIRCLARRESIFSARGVKCKITCRRSARDRSLRSNCWRSSRFTISTVLRSEEHTSELQSPCNLVCRLLL